MTKTANVGRQFMEIMKDYMERQDYDSFDVAVEIDNLYTDLSNLYYNNINDWRNLTRPAVLRQQLLQRQPRYILHVRRGSEWLQPPV